MKNKFRTLDLFAGVGGIRLGFENAGFKTVFANDFDESCKETYDSNFDRVKLNTEDINELHIVSIPEFDVLLGGFPCQAFSIAGYRLGFQDKEKGNLFFRIANILEARKPKAFLLENVKNLKGHDKGRTFEVITDTLENKLGYYIKSEVLNSMVHGNIPQNRERIFIAGFKSEKQCNKFKFPGPMELTKNFRKFIAPEADKKYYYEGKYIYPRIKDHIVKEDAVYQWRRKYVRENKKGVVPTLTANMGAGGHNVPIIRNSKGIRKLTPRECFLLQGFPHGFKLPKELSDAKLYHQAGNSVTVPVIERIAENMMKVLRD